MAISNVQHRAPGGLLAPGILPAAAIDCIRRGLYPVIAMAFSIVPRSGGFAKGADIELFRRLR